MKRIYNLIILVILVLAAIAWYIFNKKTDLVTNGSPDFTYTINDLLKEGYMESEQEFNEKHVGKRIEITGQVSAKNLEVSGTPIFLKTDVENVVIMASFDDVLHEKIEKVTLGETVKLLCICNGVDKPEDDDDLLSEIHFTFNRCDLLLHSK
jgi:RecJ-like exonuclease